MLIYWGEVNAAGDITMAAIVSTPGTQTRAAIAALIQSIAAGIIADDPTIIQAAEDAVAQALVDSRVVIGEDAPSEFAWGAMGTDTRAPLWVGKDGVAHAPGGVESPFFGPMRLVPLNPHTGYVYGLMDGNRRAPFAIRTDGAVDLIPSAATKARMGTGSGSGGRVINRDSDGADLVLILGQSNAQGAGTPYDMAEDVTLVGLDQYAGSGPSIGTVIPAVDSLYHRSQWTVAGSGAPRVGPGMEFGRLLWQSQPSNRSVLLVPAAQGSTSITGDENYSWDPDNTTAATNLYNWARSQVAAALALHARNKVVAIIWHQGESDASAGATQAWYLGKLIQIITGVREITGEDTPFLIGSMVPELIETQPGRVPIDNAHREVTGLVPYTAYIPGPHGMNQDDLLHYNAEGARELGRRYFLNALPAALVNTIPGGA